jgi:hypothetical protein
MATTCATGVVRRKRKRVPLWLAQLYMYRYLVGPARVTLATSAQFLLESIKRDSAQYAQDSLQRELGEGKRTAERTTSSEAFKGLQRDWTKL